MGIQCQILLSPQAGGIHKAGQSVTGTLNFKINKMMVFESIIISLQGQGHCSWTEGSDDTEERYYNDEEIMMLKYNILNCGRNLIKVGEKSSGPEKPNEKEEKPVTGEKSIESVEKQLEEGEYSHFFDFKLPENIPPSYKDHECNITYRLVASFTRAKKRFGRTKQFDVELNIVNNYVERSLAEPITFGLVKNLMSSAGPVELIVEIQKTLLRPGDDLHLKCLLRNDSDVDVGAVKISLVTRLTYISTLDHTKVNSQVTSGIECPGTKKNSIASFLCIVPSSPLLCSLQHSTIFKREYFLNIIVKVPFPHVNAMKEVPIVIGEGKEMREQNTYFEKTDYNFDKESQYANGVFNYTVSKA